VGGGTVASREDLTGDDEGGGVGSEVLDCQAGRSVRRGKAEEVEERKESVQKFVKQ
jgi:hypothetical protein